MVLRFECCLQRQLFFQRQKPVEVMDENHAIIQLHDSFHIFHAGNDGFGNYDIAVRPFDDFMDCVHDKGHGSCCRPGNEQVVTQFYFFRGIFA